ncbi:MAG: hypothetical protein QW304_08925 [Thermoproteota archaeon]
MKAIRTEISKGGRVKIEFIGFPGNSCSQERERLREVLISLGLELDPGGIQRKSDMQIAEELSQPSQALNKAKSKL